MFRFIILSVFIFMGTFAQAATQYYRWGSKPGMTDDLHTLLVELNKESGQNLAYADFAQFERRDMANYRFTHYLQLSGGVPVAGAMVRTWVNLKTGQLAQMEAHVEPVIQTQVRAAFLKQNKTNFSAMKSAMSNLDTMKFVREGVLRNRDDQRIGNVKFQDQWDNLDLQRRIQVTGRRGTHIITVSHLKKAIVSYEYQEFAQADVPEIDVLVYPIYEETDKNVAQQRVPAKLKNLLSVKKQSSTDPYEVLRARKYPESMYHPVLGETPEGQLAGHWSLAWLVRTAKAMYEALPWVENSYDNGGLQLVGKYTTINFHPEVKNLKGLSIPLNYSGQINYLWKETPAGWELIPMGAFAGTPLMAADTAKSLPARRLPDHDPVSYINDGFDQVQVYYAVDTLMESMHQMGFTDPELSTRPFHAFLYDPDVSMRDNAYYTADTINFTTYSAKQQNYARDNSTIWHELGHGIMDRLMGDMVRLADTGGLSEGMADFLALLVVQHVTDGNPFDGSDTFRIMNRTGFNLTNEVHDDGESYGGAMRDIMDLAIAKYGRPGLLKMADLTLDTMRLTRNHPALTANDWFEHMQFADQMGSSNRAAGELGDMIVEALRTRNFRLDRGPVASTVVLYDAGSELTSRGLASRENPFPHTLTGAAEATHTLSVKMVSGAEYPFKYPVKVEISFNGGPLQGGVKWKNEAAGPITAIINNEAELAKLSITALAGCDFVNRPDGSCSDFAYIQMFNAGETHPVSKKRFYVRVSAP